VALGGPPRSGIRRLNPVERWIRRVDRYQQQHSVLAFPWAVLQKFGNDQGGAKAALMAYYGLFALFPALLLLTTILGFVLAGDNALRHRILDTAFGSFPIIGTELRSSTHPLTGSGAALAVGILGTIYGTLGLGQAAQSAMNAVWNIPYVRWPNFILRNLRALGVIVLLGLAVVGSTILTGFATAVATGTTATVLAFLGAAVLNFGLFLLAFIVLTAEPVGWRDVWLGATLATVFWQVLQIVGSTYISHVRHSSDVYGFFAIVITLLSWLYLGAHLFLMAAEINVVRRYRLWPRSITQPPLTSGDRRTFERLALMEVRRPEMAVTVTFPDEADRDPLAELEAGDDGSRRTEHDASTTEPGRRPASSGG
jgi:YihY family inner membrane protein